jgi:hypothetical protein
MTTAKAHIYNAATGETIERDLTVEELAQAAIDESASKAASEAQDAKVIAREELLERLGITSEEAQLLLGGI